MANSYHVIAVAVAACIQVSTVLVIRILSSGYRPGDMGLGLDWGIGFLL